MKLRALLLPAIVLLALPAFAGVGKISTPLVTNGEAEVEYSGVRYGDDGKARNNAQGHELELEYGFSDRLMVGVEVSSERASPDSQKFDAYGLEGQYTMTRQGSWWVDSAIKAEYGRAFHDGDADTFELFLLLAKHYGATDIVANIGTERELGSNRDHGLAMNSRLLVAHTLNEHFAPGIEWHADYGKLNDLGAHDEHYVGPSLNGELFELGSSDLEYHIGYYWGLTHDSTDNAARLQLEYGFKF